MPRPPLRTGRQATGVALRKIIVWLSAAVATQATSPTITAGTGAPSATEPNGSVYYRTNGLVYRRTAGAWIREAAGFSVSAEGTGTGASQNVAHGLGVAPSNVVIAVTEDPAGTGFDVAEGTHTTTNVVLTVTSGVKFKILAFV